MLSTIGVWIYLTLHILYNSVDCELIGNNSFIILSRSALTDGIWTARAACNIYNPGISYNPHETYVVARFGVPITTYKDYLAGSYTETAPNGKWVISRVGYGGSSGTLSYTPEFNYDLWLGAGIPSGDCYQFTDLTEAENFAYNAAELFDTPADTLISTAPVAMGPTSASGSQASCGPSFIGLSVGAREAMVLINFTVPVEYTGDYFGNTILHEATDQTWYIVKDVYSRLNGALYTFNFKFTTSDHDVSGAKCFMYVSESDAVSAAASWSGDVTTTTTTAVTYVTTQTSQTTTDSTVTPPMSVTGVVSSRLIIPHSPRTQSTTGHFVASQDMRDRCVGENSLWNKTDGNLLQCIRTCLADDKCVSAFYVENSFTCTGHGVIYGSGDSLTGILYYVYST